MGEGGEAAMNRVWTPKPFTVTQIGSEVFGDRPPVTEVMIRTDAGGVFTAVWPGDAGPLMIAAALRELAENVLAEGGG
jgi:hypothetical protein